MPSCSKSILPNSHQPKQNQAYSEIAKIKVNPTQVLDLLAHPVLVYDLSGFFRYVDWLRSSVSYVTNSTASSTRNPPGPCRTSSRCRASGSTEIVAAAEGAAGAGCSDFGGNCEICWGNTHFRGRKLNFRIINIIIELKFIRNRI